MKNLQFITSVSKEYWYDTGQYCINTWDLPGDVTIYIDPVDGCDTDWINELPFNKRILYVPTLETKDKTADNAKVNKFWGKSSAQLHAVYNNENYDRIIWLDADVQQTSPISQEMFTFEFEQPLGIMNTGFTPDCWETGLVIFNCEFTKIKIVMNRYRAAWNTKEILDKLWKPYDAQVLGYVAKDRGYYNICETNCKNIDAFKNSRYNPYFKHWINKDNKELLKNEKC